MRICAYQPDFPHNLGGFFRLGVCFGVAVHVIEPCGFPWSSKALRQSGLDYAERATVARHDGWAAFLATQRAGRGRLALLTTAAHSDLWDAELSPEDWLLFGSESRGAPDEVHAAADIRLRIPMAEGARSLNIVTAAAIALGEVARRSGWRGGEPLGRDVER